ncbi:hypothetical protein [Rhizobium sp. FY34]|uniref:hypothetical protein n=1 Tax=Rhizobium sp. FY34 TaxID=2562309 RepID=UPI0010C0C557|nr:hypothetical protein [Rhizobium sp. FY34]
MPETLNNNAVYPDALRDLESRMVALEIISMSALALAMDTSENADVDQAEGIANLILETVGRRCDELHLSAASRRSATCYAERLLGTALQSLYTRTQ